MTHAKDGYTSDDDFDLNEKPQKSSVQNGMEQPETDTNSTPRTTQKRDKTFEELVEESTRLPDISPTSHLPMTMTEILRSSKKQTSTPAGSTNLPKISRGQVQLVCSDHGKAKERKRKLREKKSNKLNRPRRPSPQQQLSSDHSDFNSDPASLGSRNGNKAKEQTQWKKKLHRRQNKRRMAPDVDPCNSPSCDTNVEVFKTDTMKNQAGQDFVRLIQPVKHWIEKEP